MQTQSAVTTTHACSIPAADLSRTQSELELVVGLARVALEALEAAEGAPPPDTVWHALKLILERTELAANDLDAWEEAGLALKRAG